MPIHNDIGEVLAITRGPRSFVSRNFTGSQDTVVTYGSSFWGSREVLSEKIPRQRRIQFFIATTISFCFVITFIIICILASEAETLALKGGRPASECYRPTEERQKSLCQTLFRDKAWIGSDQELFFVDNGCDNEPRLYRLETLGYDMSQVDKIFHYCTEYLSPNDVVKSYTL